MFVENCAEYEIVEGKHLPAGDNAMLIQITDPDCPFPVPANSFKEVRQFRFLDVEDYNERAEEFGISDAQADEIVTALKFALENGMNVIVHCVMGVCRSGAVADFAVSIGFQDSGKWRQPNVRVKKKLFNSYFGEDYKPIGA